MSAEHTHALYVHGHSPVHRLPAHVKLVGLLVLVVAVVVTPREALWAFGVHGFLLLTVLTVAELPVWFVLRRMAIELPFVAFAFALPFLAGGEQTTVAGVEVSREGMWAAWNVLAKATAGTAASVLLAATTEIPDLLAGLRRLRVPATLVAVTGFMVRYLELVVEESRRTKVAMAARGYQPRWIWQSAAVAAGAGALFVRSYERGERVHRAMLARGYRGHLPEEQPAAPSGPGEWMRALALPVTACLTALLALVGS